MRQSSLSATLMLSAIAGVGTQADAQDDGDRPVIMQELIVQGELQERTLQDTTTSVTVITGEELDRADDFDLYDVIERTPNVGSSFGEKGFSIRGIDQRGPDGGGSGLLVSVAVDGASIPENNATFFGPYSTWDLQQIEVLRGPQSTQQGRNALAGAIVIRSQDPTYDFEIKGRGEIAERGTFGGAVAFNAPIIEDTLSFRFSAEHVETDGIVTNPTLGIDDYDAREQTTVRGKLRFDPTEDFSAVLSLTYAENFGGEDFVEAAFFPDERINLSDVEAREGSEHLIGGLRMTYDINERLTIESETTYYDNDYVRVEDFDGTPAAGGDLSRDRETESFEQDIKLRYTDARWSAVVGGYLTKIDSVATASSDIDGGNFGFPPGTRLSIVIDGETETLNYAVFGEAEYRVLPQLGVIFGGRYDREEVDQFDRQGQFAPSVGLENLNETRTSTTFDAFLPKVGAVYDWTDRLSTGIVVQCGYRSGGAQLNGFTGVLNEFEPEFTWNFEASLRSEWLDDRLTLNANAFYTLWRNQQVSVAGPSGNVLDINTVNAGRSRLFGGELEARGRPMPQLDVFAALGFVNTEYIDFISNGVDLSGNRFNFAPRVTAAFGGTYFFDNGFEVHADASYTGAQFTDSANTEANRVDGRFLVNARVGYQAENWGVFLYARNLLDNDYVLQTDGITGSRLRTGEPLTVGAIGTFTF